MSLPARFDAVVFDAYGTLFDVYSVAQLADELFPGRGDALSQLWRVKQLEYSWLRAMSGRYKPFWDITHDALQFSAARLALPLSDASGARLMDQYSRLSAFPENLEVLRTLRSSGVALGILTNGNRDMIDMSVRSAGMDGIFDHVLSSQAVSTFKTMDNIYALGPAAFGCPAQRILFVSSNCWDAIGARWYGYTSFWINRSGLPLDRLDTEPHFTGSRLTDLLPICTGAKT